MSRICRIPLLSDFAPVTNPFRSLLTACVCVIHVRGWKFDSIRGIYEHVFPQPHLLLSNLVSSTAKKVALRGAAAGRLVSPVLKCAVV